LNFKITNGSFSRVQLWLVYFLPTLLALWHSGGNGRTWQTLLWSAAACAFPAILPRILFVVIQWLSVMLLPSYFGG
jgi:hypothetical protein